MRILGVVASLLVCGTLCHAAEPVRSTLYPANWKLGYTGSSGGYLHDFSYAGYHKSEVPLPKIETHPVDVSKAPYDADTTGAKDATAALQHAIDDVEKSGGGVVFMPAGTYQLHFQAGKNYCILVSHSNMVLRGAGLDKTHLLCDETVTREKNAVLVQPDDPPWWWGTKGTIPVVQDLLMPTTTVALQSVSGLKIGQPISIQNSFTDGFLDEIGMKGKWNEKIRGIALIRRITAIDPKKNTITIDTPTRYPMKVRDKLRVLKLKDTAIKETGLEDFSVGMPQNRTPGMAKDHAAITANDYVTKGTGAYEVHNACAVSLTDCEDCWALRIGTFHPQGNDDNVDIHSNGLRLSYTRQVTVQACDFRFPQYRGGGGNGYLYMVNGNDNLFRDCMAVAGRHNYDVQRASAIGNVFFHCTADRGLLASDYHMYFATANLFDSMICDQDFLECVYRPYGGTPVHGYGGSQNVFWNTRGLAYGRNHFIVISQQAGQGYVIGTQGPADAVSPKCKGHVELVGQGETLQPASLWQDQLQRRLEKEMRPEPIASKSSAKPATSK